MDSTLSEIQICDTVQSDEDSKFNISEKYSFNWWRHEFMFDQNAVLNTKSLKDKHSLGKSMSNFSFTFDVW